MSRSADIRSLIAALRLFHGDPVAMTGFDLSESGFWSSFRTLPVVVGLYLALDIWADPSLSTAALVLRGVFYAVDYLSLALIMIPVARTTGLGPRYVPFVIASNWASLPASLAITLFTLIGAQIGNVDALAFVNLALLVGLFAYQWNVTRVSLETGRLATLGILIIGTATSLTIGSAANFALN